MAIFPMFVAIALLECVLSRSIPPYELCMEGCGPDPPRRDIAGIRRVELCRDRCNREERSRCLAAHPNDKPAISKCWTDARDRCIERCRGEQMCIRICRNLHAQPAQ
ncbi:hypothetical protein CSKR_108598 [Clonorchis sinensis]|uniref:Uncharacterized protein n=1 Tax=Clonorchis sinensis TaxID=79923 RepID=A0A8T1LZ60_CLOSI|nr:hypothetical protein CSKR_108598 [Clonorchis sinensis]